MQVNVSFQLLVLYPGDQKHDWNLRFAFQITICQLPLYDFLGCGLHFVVGFPRLFGAIVVGCPRLFWAIVVGCPWLFLAFVVDWPWLFGAIVVGCPRLCRVFTSPGCDACIIDGGSTDWRQLITWWNPPTTDVRCLTLSFTDCKMYFSNLENVFLLTNWQMNLSELMEAPQTVARNLMKPPTTDGRCNYGKLAHLFFFFKNGKMHSSDFTKCICPNLSMYFRLHRLWFRTWWKPWQRMEGVIMEKWFTLSFPKYISFTC